MLKVLRVPQVLVVQQVVLDHRVSKVPLALKVIRVSKVLRDLQVLLVLKVLKVYKEHRASRVLKVFKVPQVLVVQQVVLDQLDHKVLKETLVVLRSTIHLNLIPQTLNLVQEILD